MAIFYICQHRTFDADVLLEIGGGGGGGVESTPTMSLAYATYVYNLFQMEKMSVTMYPDIVLP